MLFSVRGLGPFWEIEVFIGPVWFLCHSLGFRVWGSENP